MSEVVKSVGRIFDVMEHFESCRTPMSLKQVAEHFNWPTSSTAALLKSLVLRGYLDYDRFGRTYLPTMRMATLGNWVEDALCGETPVREVMAALSDLTGETITLGVQSDIYAQHVHVLPALHSMQVVLRPGTVRPLVRSGLGALLLSVRDDETIDIIRRRCNIEEAALPPVEQSELMQRIGEIRAQGFMFASDTFVRGTSIVGVLTPTRAFQRVMSINVIGPTSRLAERRDEIVAIIHARFATCRTDTQQATPQGTLSWPASQERLAGAEQWR